MLCIILSYLFAALLVTTAWNGIAKARRLDDGTPAGRERVTEAKDRFIYAAVGLVAIVGGHAALWWFLD
jgi:hypothetical protein